MASKLNKYQFRSRERHKELYPNQEFKVTNHETSLEKITRIENENQKALLFEKYKSKIKDFEFLRKDNKTMRNRIGFRHNPDSEISRVNQVIRSR